MPMNMPDNRYKEQEMIPLGITLLCLGAALLYPTLKRLNSFEQAKKRIKRAPQAIQYDQQPNFVWGCALCLVGCLLLLATHY
jgi:hypothetical protein